MTQIPLLKRVGPRQALQNTIIVAIIITTLIFMLLWIVNAALESTTANRMNLIREGNKDQVLSLLEESRKNLEFASSNPDLLLYTRQLIQYHQEMQTGSEASFDISDRASNLTRSYDSIKANLRETLLPYQKAYEVNDIYLICAKHGHIMFSLEERPDFTTNLMYGRYKDSPLSRLWAETKKKGKVTFEDVDLYKGVNNEPVLMAGAPVWEGETIQAVLAFDLPLRRINNIMTRGLGLDKTGESYLVGPDNRMRSDSLQDPANRNIKTSFIGSPEKNGIQSTAARQGLAGQEGQGITENYRGQRVVASWSPLSFQELNWAILAEIQLQEVRTPIWEILRVTWGIGGGILVVIILLSLWQSRRLTRPLNQIMKASEQIACGNLSVEITPMSREDELGRLNALFIDMIQSLQNKEMIIRNIAQGAGDFTIQVEMASEEDSLGNYLQSMLHNLNSILSQVSTASQQVSQGADQVSHTSQTLSQGATQQASSLEEISASINSIAQQSRQNADNSGEANTLVKKASLQANQGNALMGELSSAMDEINHSSDQIGKVVKVIDDISFQINLLALNANVEAARAGKYGKGFAVVAEEVRNLAGKSAKAVKETTAMVQETQKNITRGAELAGSTAEELSNIVSGISRVADIIAEISLASREQSLSIDEITNGLSQIDTVTQENTASAEESAAAAEELASQSQQVLNLISRFRLKEEAPPKLPQSPPRPPRDKKPKAKRVKPKEDDWIVHKDSESEETGIKPLNPEEIISLQDEDFDNF